MTLSQYLRVARANWLLIAALTALGALGAAAYAWAQTPMYSASAQMFVSTTGNDSDIATITQGSTLAQQRVKSYAAIITAPDVLDPVIKQLKLPYANATELSGHVTASSPLDTVLLDVKVTDTVPERARDTANAVAAQFTDYVGRLELPSGKGTSPVKVTVTAPAVAAGAPDSPKKMLDLALGLLVGLGLGIGLAVLRDSLDRGQRRPQRQGRPAHRARPVRGPGRGVPPAAHQHPLPVGRPGGALARRHQLGRR